MLRVEADKLRLFFKAIVIKSVSETVWLNPVIDTNKTRKKIAKYLNIKMNYCNKKYFSDGHKYIVR